MIGIGILILCLGQFNFDPLGTSLFDVSPIVLTASAEHDCNPLGEEAVYHTILYPLNDEEALGELSHTPKAFNARPRLPYGVLCYAEAYDKAAIERKPILVAIGVSPLRMIDIAEKAFEEGWIVAWEPKSPQFSNGVHRFGPPELRQETVLFLPEEPAATPSERGRFIRSGRWIMSPMRGIGRLNCGPGG